ncbi:hypothetical protein GCM10008967_17580 [Bacillus carboniphilus]|uniref:Uncharacterized protein n=1 Tax=Bacillus carboniphilus TaxID=86663 RepID=A0ABP3FVP5_9BACI
MTTLCSQHELTATKEALEQVEKAYPNLYEKLLHVVHLTRNLHFRYQYMGCLILDEDPGQHAPNMVYDSVMNLYKTEVHRLKIDEHYEVIKDTLKSYQGIGFANISQLILGRPAESLVGGSSIK